MEKIWNLFYKKGGEYPDETVDATDVKPTPKTAAKSATRPTVVRTMSGSPASATAIPSGNRLDPDIRTQLEQAMLGDNDNSVGQLLAMMSSLAEDISDPAKLLRAALKALKGQGCTPEKILADIVSDENILTAQEAGFKDYSATERDKRLGSRQGEMDVVTASMNEKENQIARLREEIAQLASRQGTLQAETETEARNISDVEARFATTLAAVRGERNELKTRIETQGKGV